MALIEIDGKEVGWERIGRKLAWGAVTGVVLFALCVSVIGFALDRVLGFPDHDATDSSTERSGMKLRTDYGTGCQYLEARLGGITPRFDASGKQICRS